MLRKNSPATRQPPARRTLGTRVCTGQEIFIFLKTGWDEKPKNQNFGKQDEMGKLKTKFPGNGTQIENCI